jgi:hypothetical protein
MVDFGAMARNLFILIFCLTITVLLGRGYFVSLRSGVLTVEGRTSRRDLGKTHFSGTTGAEVVGMLPTCASLWADTHLGQRRWPI